MPGTSKPTSTPRPRRFGTARHLAALLALCLALALAAGCTLQEQVDKPAQTPNQQTQQEAAPELPASSNPYAVQNLADAFDLAYQGTADDGSTILVAISKADGPALAAVVAPDGTGTCIVGTWVVDEPEEEPAPEPEQPSPAATQDEADAQDTAAATDETATAATAADEPAFEPEVVTGTLNDPLGSPIALALTSQEDGSWLLECELSGPCRVFARDPDAALLELVRSGLYSNERAAQVAQAAAELEEQERHDQVAQAEAQTQLQADEESRA